MGSNVRRAEVQAARLSGATTYRTGVPCSRGHISPRWTASRTCVACDAVVAARYREQHPGRVRAWIDANKAHWRETIQARKRKRKGRIPAWADIGAIRAIYREARRVSQETGVAHEVDHFYPLLGKTVCGLHCEANLQIITKTANRSKGYRNPDEDWHG